MFATMFDRIRCDLLLPVHRCSTAAHRPTVVQLSIIEVRLVRHLLLTELYFTTFCSGHVT